jgi:PPOX class probable F420-dependent enzyme
VRQLSDINTHAHHISIGAIANPVRCANRYFSLPLVDRVVVSEIFDFELPTTVKRGPPDLRPGERSGAAMTSDPATTLGEQRFVLLTTFKRNGEGVQTPMWIGRDGADLFVWTPAGSWKVKRVRNNPRVLLAPSSRFGKVRDGVSPVEGTAQVVIDPVTVERLQREIRRKYGLGYRLATLAEMIAARGRKPRVILRIALSH